jgi:hypothetical protein
MTRISFATASRLVCSPLKSILSKGLESCQIDTPERHIYLNSGVGCNLSTIFLAALSPVNENRTRIIDCYNESGFYYLNLELVIMGLISKRSIPKR